MPLSAPASLEKEHQEILQLLMGVQNLSGKTGSIAEKLAKDLKSHIDREESLALPLLGILRDLVNGKLTNASARRASITGRSTAASLIVARNAGSLTLGESDNVLLVGPSAPATQRGLPSLAE